MKRCANCQTAFVFGAREFDGKIYCSKECQEFAAYPNFCAACQQGTVDVSTGNLVTINFVGEAFLGSSQECPECHSVERHMFFFFGIPLLPLGKWKVKYVEPRKFITRKIMTSGFPDVARQHLPKGKGRINPLVWFLVGALLLAFTFPVIYAQIYN